MLADAKSQYSAARNYLSRHFCSCMGLFRAKSTWKIFGPAQVVPNEPLIAAFP